MTWRHLLWKRDELRKVVEVDPHDHAEDHVDHRSDDECDRLVVPRFYAACADAVNTQYHHEDEHCAGDLYGHKTTPGPGFSLCHFSPSCRPA